jgi:PPOX class probable F420-dependent enzyme
MNSRARDELADALELLASVRIGRLATTRPDGSPHLVPVVFAIDGEAVVTAIDDKPKSSARLTRVENILRDPRVSFLADYYAEDWSVLWWVRIDGSAVLEEVGEDFERGIAALRDRYDQYRRVGIPGPLIRIRPTRVARWTASGS